MSDGEVLAALQAHVGQPLEEGWRVLRTTRSTGASAGHADVYFISPSGKRLRSRAEVARFLGASHAPSAPAASAAVHASDVAARSPAAAARVPVTTPRTTSPYFAPPDEPPARRRRQGAAPVRFVGAARKAADCKWVPPASPFGLIQEALYEDPWKVLVACALLNKTSGLQVRRCIFELFKLIPSPHAALATPVEEIRRIIAPLGLVKRAELLVRLSAAYLGEWKRVSELPTVGKYASDAYSLFCSGEWRELTPEDKELMRYHAWLKETNGEGCGYAREAAFS